MMSTTILHRLAEWADENPNDPAQCYKKDSEWAPISAKEFCDRVYWLALFLESKGMTSNDIGTIFSGNCPEWVHLDLAPLLIGAKSAGIYPNSTSKDALYILNHTESRFLAIQNKEFFNKLVGPEGEAALPSRVQQIIVFDGDSSISAKAISYETALAIGKSLASQKGARTFKDYLNQLDPHAPSFMIYTSGTTGHPKGALLSQDNLCFTVDRIVKHWDLPKGKKPLFSFLPLCHIAEKIQNIGGGISQRYTVYFGTRFDQVSKEMPQVQPALLLCVPRVWEKMMERVQREIDESSIPQRQLAYWALGVGARIAKAKYEGSEPKLADRLQYILADRLILSKIREALGLAHAEVLASGAAALSPHVCRWFRSIGLEIMEVFGQTESTGVICLTLKGVECSGTVGKPVHGMEVKIAEDGEMLTRGRHVFKGYFKDDAATTRTVIDGWLHTGDLAERDKRGFLRIKGRKKEVMKTSGGKMIAPLPIEEALKSAPSISQVCMVGDGRKYLSALITLSESKRSQLNNGALKNKVVTEPPVVDEIKKHIDQLNRTLASYEQIKKFAILSQEFSIAEGEMTPTLKMKRDVIENRYRDVIETFYDAR